MQRALGSPNFAPGTALATAEVRVPDTAPGADLPERWRNLIPLLPAPLPPPKDPDDGKASRVAAVERLRLREVVAQDRSEEPWIPIPGRVLDEYARMGRPTPLTRLRSLEEYLETPARILVKREDALPTGSFKLNSAVAQAYFAEQEGAQTLVTETGAGQWGHAVAYASRLFGIRPIVFWAAVSRRQKQGRDAILRMLGAEVHSSPSPLTESGRRLLATDAHALGSLGTAIGEAISHAADTPGARYLSGSNVPHVLLHQTVIGLETRQQLELLGQEPDVLIACVGGGSNLGGFIGPFLPDKARRGDDLRLVGAEAATAPRLTQGTWRYDHADPLGVTPLTKSYTLGREYVLPETHIGGLRQHSGSPAVSLLRHHGLLEARAYHEREVFETGELVVRLEGFVPAPESCHALRAVVEEAVRARQEGRQRTIVACVSGSGLLDLDGYLAARAEGSA